MTGLFLSLNHPILSVFSFADHQSLSWDNKSCQCKALNFPLYCLSVYSGCRISAFRDAQRNLLSSCSCTWTIWMERLLVFRESYDDSICKSQACMQWDKGNELPLWLPMAEVNSLWKNHDNWFNTVSYNCNDPNVVSGGNRGRETERLFRESERQSDRTAARQWDIETKR